MTYICQLFGVSRQSYYQARQRWQDQQQYAIQCSMTDGYDCYQNALAERVNGILKYEFLVIQPRNLAQTQQMVAESVAIYNQHRPHLSLQFQTPNQVHYKLTTPSEPGVVKIKKDK